MTKEEIKRVRLINNMTQVEMAKFIGVSIILISSGKLVSITRAT